MFVGNILQIYKFTSWDLKIYNWTIEVFENKSTMPNCNVFNLQSFCRLYELESSVKEEEWFFTEVQHLWFGMEASFMIYNRRKIYLSWFWVEEQTDKI